jgi:alpha-tubulin suppressor-like RCC1 family protein
MLSNIIRMAYAASASYTPYVAPPNYLWGTGAAFQGALDNDASALKFGYILDESTDWQNIDTNLTFSVAVKTNGTLWAWGVGNSGQLGLNNLTSYSSPVQIGTLSNWLDIACGYSHTIAVKNDYTLWGWGINSSGQLGDGGTLSKSSPVQIGTLSDWLKLAAGVNCSISIKTDGTLWAWGLNTSGQLGDGTAVNKSSPVQIGTLSDWADVTIGNSHTIAIKTDGTLWGWGLNGSGQLGDGTRTTRSSPVQIGTLSDWLAASCGISHTMAVKIDGTLWAWGNNTNRQFGDGSSTSTSSPVQVGTLSNWTVNISTGGNSTAAIQNNGTLWAWGSNSEGQLGNQTTTTLSNTTQIGSATDWSKIVMGQSHAMALKTNGKIQTVGFINGVVTSPKIVLGRSDLMYSSPIQINHISNISSIAGDLQSTIALKTDGTLWAWGNNSIGRLGLNDLIWYDSPVQIGTLSNWAKINMNFFTTMAIKTDGTLWGWGSNTSGKIGVGNVTSYSSPVQIGTLSDWAQVSIGQSHTVAIKTNGTLWSWGAGAGGALGEGLLSAVFTLPVQVGTLSNWKTVSLSDYNHAAALKTDGTIWTWGTNIYGEMGNGSTITTFSSPVQVGTLSTWASASACDQHSLFLTT